MADTKISDLTDGTTPAGSDKFAVARAGDNNSLTWTEMLTAVKAVTLDLFAAPAASIAMNTKKLTGLAAGTTSGDSIRYEQVFAAGAVPIADLADPTTGKVIGSASSAAAAVYPPGYEIGYDEITSSVTVASNAEATGTTIITCAAHTFDGSPVICTFYAPLLYTSGQVADTALGISLFESTTEIARIGEMFNGPTLTDGLGVPVLMQMRFTPTAASHTYIVKAYVDKAGSTTSQIVSGNKGTAGRAPAFVRFAKV